MRSPSATLFAVGPASADRASADRASANRATANRATASPASTDPAASERASEPDIRYVVLRAPGISVFADDPVRRAALLRAVERVGARLVASGSLADAAAGLDRGGANIVVDVDAGCAVDAGPGAASGDVLDEILGRLDAAACHGRSAVLVLTPLALIDRVVARIADPRIAILVDADAADRDAALAALASAPPAYVAEEGEAENRRRLAQLGDEVGRIARALAALSGERSDAKPGAALAPIASHGPLVRAILRVRRLRGLHFEPALFADPAWDILLDLAAARIEGRMVAVSSLCIAAAVPATTALRWIAQMTDQALLVRQPDASDGRRVFIGLSEAAASGMDAYCSAAQRIIAPAT